MFKHMATVWMALRDCMAPRSERLREMQEAVVADLHTCLEQLQTRTQDMEAKATRCGEQALYHMQQAQRGTAPARQRDRQRAKGHMEERRRLLQQMDKAAQMSSAIQKQIDSIVSSHMDMLIVDAMRGFNHAATNMALPQRGQEVDALAEQLADRQSEVDAMQEAIMGISSSMNISTAEDDSDLWRELDDLMHADEPKQHDVAIATEIAQMLPAVPQVLPAAHQELISFEPVAA